MLDKIDRHEGYKLAEMKEKALIMIDLCISDDVMYHMFDLMMSNEVCDKLESQRIKNVDKQIVRGAATIQID